MSIKEIIDGIIAREGGFSNRPSDLGGATRYGITLAKLAEWRRKPVSIRDVKRLSMKEARAIYEKDFILKPKFHLIKDERLREHLIDCGVNSGTMTAVLWLQRAVGTVVDGKLGPKTLAALATHDPINISNRVMCERFEHYGRIITDDSRLQDVHGNDDHAKGWSVRATSFLREV